MIKYPLNIIIDTNVFEANKFDFSTDSAMSLLVKNVQNGEIELIPSNVIISGVEKHICLCVDDVRGKARELRKEYLDILPEQYLVDIGMGIYVQIPDKKTIYQNAKDIFARFLEDCEVERLDTGSINLEEILEDYFAVRPPFRNSEKKRKEFPDAFIAEEIRKRFGSNEIVAVVSQDDDFKKACTNSKNHLFFSSLGDLFNELSENEEEYAAALELIKGNNDSILQIIKRMISDSCAEAYGLSYDQGGIVNGRDYDKTYLERCNLSGMRLHTIDDIDGDIITASLLIHGNVDVSCYFEDFNNASWGYEEEEYVCVEIRHAFEEHSVRLARRVEFNSKAEEIRVLPFKVVLGGDSRKSRVEIDGEQETLYRGLEDADREGLGFLPLSKYSDKLENDLNESSMTQAMFRLSEQCNDISSCYEELLVLYDEIYAQAKSDTGKDDAKVLITALSSGKSIPIDFSEKNINDLLDEIKEWLDYRFDMVSEGMERNLPNYIEYGENITILSINCRVYALFLDELYGTSEADSGEQVKVSLLSDKETLARDYIKLTAGYLGFDEDGGTSDDIENSIDYRVDDVLNVLKDLISDLEEELVSEQELTNSIKNCLKR